MKIKIQDSDQRIYGYGSFGAGMRNGFTYIDYTWISPPEDLKDEYGYTLYRWDGNDPVLDPINPTTEEKEERREFKVEQKIKDMLPRIIRILANDPFARFDDLKAEIKAIDDEITIEAKKAKK